MIREGNILTSQVDRHNCQVEKKALLELSESINKDEFAMSISIEHDVQVMPIGKVISSKIVDLDDGEIAVKATHEIFDKFDPIKLSDGYFYYTAKSEIDNRPFVTFDYNNDSIIFSSDINNYDKNEFKKIMDYAKNDCGFKTSTTTRKSLIPDPIIILQLVAGTFIYQIIKKTGSKITDKIADDIARIYDLVKKLIIRAAKSVNPKNALVTYILSEKTSTYIVELVIVTNDVNDTIFAIQPEMIGGIEQAIEFFSEQIEAIAKMQFTYNINNKKWEFNYLTTACGEVLGSEKCYKHTQKLLNTHVLNRKSVNVSIEGAMESQSD